MNRPRILINVVVFAIAFFGMAYWVTKNVVSFNAIDRPYTLSANFENAFGVLPNAEVTYLGVKYGRVSDVELVPGGVDVEMEILRDHFIPEGSTASIGRKSAIGEQYVNFMPPPEADGDGPFYEPGSEIPREKTSVPLEFSEFLRSASALVGSVPPEALRTVLHEVARGLNGRTDSLRALAQAGAQFSDTLAARTEALDRLAVNSTRLTRTVAENRGAFGQSLTDLRDIAASLREASGDTRVLLEQGSAVVGRTADIVAARKSELDCVLKGVEVLVDETTTAARLAGLRALLTIGPDAFAGVWDSRDVESDGAWIRVGFLANPVENRPNQFVPPKDLPAVNVPGPCLANFAPTGVDYRPSPERASLPATGGTAALIVGMAMLAAFIAIRSTEDVTAE